MIKSLQEAKQESTCQKRIVVCELYDIGKLRKRDLIPVNTGDTETDHYPHHESGAGEKVHLLRLENL